MGQLEAVDEFPRKQSCKDQKEEFNAQAKRISSKERKERVTELLKSYINQNMPVPGTIVITPKVRHDSMMSAEQAASVMSRQLTMQFMPMLRARQRSANSRPSTTKSVDYEKPSKAKTSGVPNDQFTQKNESLPTILQQPQIIRQSEVKAQTIDKMDTQSSINPAKPPKTGQRPLRDLNGQKSGSKEGFRVRKIQIRSANSGTNLLSIKTSDKPESATQHI